MSKKPNTRPIEDRMQISIFDQIETENYKLDLDLREGARANGTNDAVWFIHATDIERDCLIHMREMMLRYGGEHARCYVAAFDETIQQAGITLIKSSEEQHV